MQSIGCKITLKSFDHATLEHIIYKFKKIATLSGVVSIIGPIRLPKKIKKYTVLRSPHIDKKSREQFEMVTYSRLLVIRNTSPVVLNSFLKYVKANTPIGVGIQLIEYSYDKVNFTS